MNEGGVFDTKQLIFTRDGIGRYVCFPMVGYRYANGADRFVMEQLNFERNGVIRQEICGYFETDRKIKRNRREYRTWEAALEVPRAYLKQVGL
jgi:hypothetical protein